MNMKKITIPARIDQVDQVIDFVNEVLESHDCSMKTTMQIDIAVEELFVNIAHYAYAPGEGEATICCAVGGEPRSVEISFIDSGTPYNPLLREDPDVTLEAEDRDIGGLGIFMVKKSMDDMRYEYADRQNRLTIRKFF